MDIISALSSILPSVLVGVVMSYYNRKQNKHFKEVAQRADDRRRESMLSLELSMANGRMSFATAMALKRGYPNGEVEEGIEAYEAAKKKYYAFLNEQALGALCNKR